MLSIGQVAARTGLAVSAIRYYEDEKLIAVDRNAGGQRRYQRADIRRLSFIIITQRLGFSIADIRGMLAELPNDRTPTQADWTRLSTRIRGVLDTRIAQMTKLRDTLDGCIGCGCLSLDRCQLYNPDDAAQKAGPGPRYILDAAK
ncbi:MAG: redox-sensitive transcriptional activator SoxR [Pseudomonadota bacterium]